MMRNHDIDVWACVGVTLGLATVSVVLRFLARRMTKVALWWDDWFAVLAFVSVPFGGVVFASFGRLTLSMVDDCSSMECSCFDM